MLSQDARPLGPLWAHTEVSNHELEELLERQNAGRYVCPMQLPSQRTSAG